MSNVDQINKNKQVLQGAKTASSSGPNAPAFSNDVSSALMFAFTCLLTASNVRCQSVATQAKASQANASAQEELLNAEQKLGVYGIPAPQEAQTPHMVYNPHYKYYVLTVNGGFEKKYRGQWVQDGWDSVLKNQAAIDAVNDKNQANDKIRNDLQNKVVVYQQNAKLISTNIDINVQGNNDSSQEAVYLLQMLKAITNKIYLNV